MRFFPRLLVVLLAALGCISVPAALYAADTPAAAAASTTPVAAAAPVNPAGAVGVGTANNAILIDLLVKKGILTSTEASSLRNVSGSAGMEQLLLLLKAKGVVSESEADELTSANAETMHSLVDTESGGLQTATLTSPQASQQPKLAEPTGPTVIPAIAPVRVLPLDPPAKDALVPALKLGVVRLLPYGFIKATEAYDSLDPTGDDFPRPGFSAADTGPTKNPEWHMKARSTRIGSSPPG